MAAKKEPDLPRVCSVYGPFNNRVLVDMPIDLAHELFGESFLADSKLTRLIEAVERDIAELAKRDPGLADSALAATAVAMAYEIAHPFNSATSKSMCAKQLREALEELRDLAPDRPEEDGVDDLSKRRAKRLAGRAAS